MNRRDFLKTCGIVIAGVVLAQLSKIFSFRKDPVSGLKEARFYRSNDRLAG